MRVLLVEDEQYLAEAIQHLLQRSGYAVDVADDGMLGLQFARNDVYDAIILDNMLPELSGVEVLRMLRKENYETPVLMLSAKSEASDKVEGLEVGADDYLAKPFKTSELVARIRAITRRHKHGEEAVITISDLAISPHDKSISCGEVTIQLTAKEYDLLDMLVTGANTLIRTETLFRRAWGSDLFVQPKYVSVYVSYLRTKLNKLDSNVQIKSVRNIGYRLTPGSEDVL